MKPNEWLNATPCLLFTLWVLVTTLNIAKNGILFMIDGCIKFLIAAGLQA